MPDCWFSCPRQERNSRFTFADKNLDRVLVAGLILEAVLDTSRQKPEPSRRRDRVKNRVGHDLL